MKSKLLFLCLALLSVMSFSQNQSKNPASKWMFGQYLGLDFMTTPPSVISNTMYASEGSASIADNAGNLLFYTNGVTIWNQFHNVMANGTGLFGNLSTTQGVMIVKQPGNSSVYYVFTIDQLGDSNGLRYSVVDMNLAVGMGSVTAKNIPLYTPSTERLAAVKHCNKSDVWIVSHDWGGNVFRSYLLTASGVTQPAVTSSVGLIHTGPNTFPEVYNRIGSMKISPNGKKLGIVSRGGLDMAEMYDFNDATGIVSNQLILQSNLEDLYGCEFSSDGSKFYVTTAEGQVSYIYQWNLCAPNPVNSRFMVDSVFDHHRAMQLGIDGKIYVAAPYDLPIGVINNPNASGASCNFVSYGQPVAPGICQLGLPGFVASYFLDPLPQFTYSLHCQSVNFTAPPTPTCNVMGFTYSSVNWNFGDGTSGSGNNATHFYAPGTYTALCIQNKNCSADTVQQVITIPSQFPNFSVSGQATICNGANTTLGINNTANSYTWMPGNIVSNLATVSPTSTTVYTVTGTNTLTGCQVSKTFTVTVNPCATTGLDEHNRSAYGISISPNPANDYIHVSLAKETPELLLVELRDISGRQINATTLSESDRQISVKHLENGIYFLLVKNEAKEIIYTGKIVKRD